MPLYCAAPKSGRDTDKVKATGLNPLASQKVAAPGFAEAELILECRQIYRDEFKAQRFLDPGIEANYNDADYHTIYFGEILAVSGVKKYKS
jgi:flavin reductase (DIM6/NTAB) family NADH-FMN oxidoreductase RutF